VKTEKWVVDAWEAASTKVKSTSLRVGSGFPHGSHDGQYQLTAPHYWTAGFWPGLLWLIHQEEQNDGLRQLAEHCEERLDPVLHNIDLQSHDIGFMWTLTSIANWKLTHNPAARHRALTAASHLAGRFNLKGRFIRAWDQPERTGWAIIDCMMNLPLLYWASEQTGDPRFKHIAVAHATTAVQHFIRADGSANHVVCFDPETGERLSVRGGQGYADESAWARGASWGLYGSVLSYRHTGIPDFLAAAERAADFFISHLPEDKVPYWDFRLPSFEHAPRDSSAAAITATGLLDLANAAQGDKAVFYKESALSILQSLGEHYRADASEEAILLRGTGNLPGNQNINRPLIYGDYYYVEALSKLMGHSSFWAPAPAASKE
jgi:unsaturated chondroitin disaccharide hydrolase